MQFDFRKLQLSFTFSENGIQKVKNYFDKHATMILFFALSMLSIASFLYYLANGLGVAYNDARSHLDISRRVVENLKPGFAQLGSVWLPLPHLLATLTIWNDFMWHSGLAGALQSMISYIATGILIYRILQVLGVTMFGRFVGLLVFALNLNVLYMQSTAMTELLLIGTMTAGVYELIQWHKEERMQNLLKSGFWIMLSTMIRYDGWFLLIFATILIIIHTLRKHNYKTTEGVVVVFGTLAGFGILLWLFWNLMIFKDPLYFITGPYSAGTQQQQLADAGVLATKHNLPFSLQTYLYAIFYNSGVLSAVLAFVGAILFWFDKNVKSELRLAATALIAPFIFNVLSLYIGQSVLFIQGLHGNSWFNVRYGLMMVPAIAVFIGYLTYRLKNMRYVIIALLLLVTFFSFANRDAVTIDDAVYGASGKNVSEISSWLRNHTAHQDGFVLISVASHDAIIFSSGMPMSRFIHEGTGLYWGIATTHPAHWARWIVMRSNDLNDQTFRLLQKNKEFKNDYTMVQHLPFADVYEIKPQYLKNLHTKPSLEL